MKSKRSNRRVRREVIHLGPDGTPDPNGLTSIIVETGGTLGEIARLPHPIDSLAEWAHRELVKHGCETPGADARSLSGPAGYALWQRSSQPLHTQEVLAAKVLVEAINCRAEIDRGNAAEAARHACVAAFHWQTRRHKPLERDTVRGRRAVAQRASASASAAREKRSRAERARGLLTSRYDELRSKNPKASRRWIASRLARIYEKTTDAMESALRRAGR